MKLTLNPTSFHGDIQVPSSKSLSHRAVICAALADGESILSQVLESVDLTATCAGMRILGAQIEEVSPGTLRVHGLKKDQLPQGGTIDCAESGSTLRFLIPLVLSGAPITLTGHGRLAERPQGPYREILDKQQIAYQLLDPTGLELPLHLQGTLQPDHFVLPGNISSQFISGLLFALPRLAGDSRISLTGPIESVGYIDLTLSSLKQFGVEIEVSDDHREYYIRGNQSYHSANTQVEGDYSQAAFWLVAGALGQGITLSGLRADSLQGDRAILDILERMGVKWAWQGNQLVVYPSKTYGAVIDGSQCPDIIPVLAVLGAASQGVTKIINAGRLRIKESDRLTAMATELRKIGVSIEEGPDSLTIEGRSHFSGGQIDSWNDHRIAMAMGVAAVRATAPLHLEGAESVQKSYPTFWKDYQQLGGKVDEC